MEYLIGVVLAFGVFTFALLTGFDRDRAFYPTILTVVAHYYVLFAVLGGSQRSLIFEFVVMTAFIVLAVTGFKTNLWLVAGALAGHGVFDFFHYLAVDNPGLPARWPGFCMMYDLIAGGLLALLLTKRAGLSRAH